MTEINKGTLTVIKIVKNKSYIVECTCGHVFKTYKSRFDIYSGKGCAKCMHRGENNSNYRHGGYEKYRYTRNSYDSIKKRCYYPKQQKYKYYGGRGIKVCDRWLESFANFLEDMGERPPKHTIDRIDNDGDYTPKNCRWATQKEQIDKQKRVVFLAVDGVYASFSDHCRSNGISPVAGHNRVFKGWSYEDACTVKPMKNQNSPRIK